MKKAILVFAALALAAPVHCQSIQDLFGANPGELIMQAQRQQAEYEAHLAAERAKKAWIGEHVKELIGTVVSPRQDERCVLAAVAGRLGLSLPSAPPPAVYRSSRILLEDYETYYYAKSGSHETPKAVATTYFPVNNVIFIDDSAGSYSRQRGIDDALAGQFALYLQYRILGRAPGSAEAKAAAAGVESWFHARLHRALGIRLPLSLDKATAAGLAALLIWSTSVALMRGMSESAGLLTGPALASLIGGGLALVWLRLRGGSVSAMLRLPPRYLFGCGALFVSCNVSLYLAVGACADRSQTLVVALVNYLWPTLTVALSVPILGRKARAFLPLGCLVAVAGTAVAMLEGNAASAAALGFWATGRGLFALGMGLVAALSWGLYSNLARLWGDPEQGAVPLFALATAAALGLLLLWHPETPRWSLRAVLEVATLGVASLMAAYALWDLGMRRGDHAFLGVCSYFVPVGSTLFSCLYLGVRPGWHVLAGCALVAAGAALSSRALSRD